ncbi:hypothetical protein, partial [Escherichia coli]
GEYLPGSLQGKISSDGCLKKEQMVVSAIASTPQLPCPVSRNYRICPSVIFSFAASSLFIRVYPRQNQEKNDENSPHIPGDAYNTHPRTPGRKS